WRARDVRSAAGRGSARRYRGRRSHRRDLPRVRRRFGGARAASRSGRRMTDVATPPAAVAHQGALNGIRVVELGFAAAGPLVGKYLANFGAEVIRLESSLAPDVFRTTYPPFKDG